MEPKELLSADAFARVSAFINGTARPLERDISGRYRYTTTYAHRDGRWQIVAGHASMLRHCPLAAKQIRQPRRPVLCALVIPPA
jgi:hypothetical protein